MEERVWQLQQQLASAGAIDITGLVFRDACIVRTARYPACSGRALHAELRAELEKRCSDAAERQLRCEGGLLQHSNPVHAGDHARCQQP